MQDKEKITEAIQALQLKLAQTDYKVIKYIEGVLSQDEYEKVHTQREAWRDEINNLEKLLNK